MNPGAAVAVTAGVFLMSGSALLAIGALIGLAAITGGTARRPSTWDIWFESEWYDTEERGGQTIEMAFMVATIQRDDPIVQRSLDMQGSGGAPDVTMPDFGSALQYAINRRAKPIYSWNDLTRSWARVY